MAKLSSKILNDCLENVARILANDTAVGICYLGMGVGTCDLVSSATQHDLQAVTDHAGECLFVTITPAYEASYKYAADHTFAFDDLTGNTFRELTICKSNVAHSSLSMCRFTYDTVILAAAETVKFTVKVAVQQGS